MKKSVFVLGDSISIQYGPYLKKMIEGNFEYDRKRGEELALADLDRPVGANGGNSRMVLEFLLEQRNAVKPNILILNCGLHDIKIPKGADNREVDLNEYGNNLKNIVTAAKKFAKEVIWVSTTPVNHHMHHEKKGFDRYNEDVEAYNCVAESVMKENNIKIIDLYTFTLSLENEPHYDGVHFKPENARLQAAFIAGFLFSLSY